MTESRGSQKSWFSLWLPFKAAATRVLKNQNSPTCRLGAVGRAQRCHPRINRQAQPGSISNFQAQPQPMSFPQSYPWGSKTRHGPQISCSSQKLPCLLPPTPGKVSKIAGSGWCCFGLPKSNTNMEAKRQFPEEYSSGPPFRGPFWASLQVCQNEGNFLSQP